MILVQVPSQRVEAYVAARVDVLVLVPNYMLIVVSLPNCLSGT